MKFRFGGMVSFSSAKDIFSKLDSPDAPSLCPKFVFTLKTISASSIPCENFGGLVSYRSYVYAVVAKDIGHRKRLDGVADLR